MVDPRKEQRDMNRKGDRGKKKKVRSKNWMGERF